VRWFDSVEQVNDAIALVDLASSRVEEQDHAMGGGCVLVERAAQIVSHTEDDGPRPLDTERAVLLVEFE
jgi:hypothetical protein